MIRYTRIDGDAPILTRAYSLDAGVDVATLKGFRICAGETMKIPTGIAIELPSKSAAFLLPRSSVSLRGLLVHTGTIDTGYRGEISVIVTNISASTLIFKPKAKIAQLVAFFVDRSTTVEVQELNESVRGARGFGSSNSPYPAPIVEAL